MQEAEEEEEEEEEDGAGSSRETKPIRTRSFPVKRVQHGVKGASETRLWGVFVPAGRVWTPPGQSELRDIKVSEIRLSSNKRSLKLLMMLQLLRYRFGAAVRAVPDMCGFKVTAELIHIKYGSVAAAPTC